MTWFLGTRFPNAIPLVFVVGYPRSGTTWVCQLIADYLRLPFPRNTVLPVGFPAVVHGHEIVWKNYPKCVYVLRDGRDAELSMFYYAGRRTLDGTGRRTTRRMRKRFRNVHDLDNVRDHIADFIVQQQDRPIASRVAWGDHVRSYLEATNPNVVLLRFEDLVQTGEVALAKTVAQLTGKEADMQRVRDTLNRYSQDAQRPFIGSLGQSGGNYLRKGRTGDWRKTFTRKAAEVFDRYWGDVLIEAGYETDHLWVDRLEE